MDAASATLALFDGEDQRTDCLEARVAWQDGRLAVETGGKRFGVTPESIERASAEDLPRPFPKQFDAGIVIQWTASDGRRRAVIEAERSRLIELSGRLCRACLDGADVRVEQQITPRQVDDSTGPKTTTEATSLDVDPSTGTVAFDADDLDAIRPPIVTTVETGSFELDGTSRTAVQVSALTPEQHTVSRVVPASSRIARLLCDHLVTAYTLTGTGGPMSVLFVDDEPALTDLAQLHMKKHHQELSIRAATSTEYAKQLLTNESFECIVSDYEMPDGGAAELLSIVRAGDRSVPFVVLSRWEESEIPAEQRPAGIDAWMQKETGVDQYHRLGELVKKLVVQRRCNA
ncbi:MAG: response regulator [Salinirussus sp.]